MKWTATALCGFAQRGRFAKADVPMAVAVALGASGGDDGLLSRPWGGSHTGYVGLWQLAVDLADTDTLAALRDPVENARRAHLAFLADDRGWSWCIGYTNGLWRAHLTAAEDAYVSGVRVDTLPVFGTVAD